jgi:guanine deaminase
MSVTMGPQAAPNPGSQASPTTRQGYRGRVLTPLDAGGPLRFLSDGLLVVEGDRIASVEPFAPGFAGEIVDTRSAVIVPGFVDAHVHFPQTRVIGSASGPLLEWLDRTVFPEEARFREAAYASAVAAEFTAALARAGTTASAVFSSSSPTATEALFAALDRSGLRAVAGLTLMDQECPEPLRLPRDRAMGACAELADRWEGHDRGRLRFAVTPRFALSCSRALLEDAARFAADRGLFVQTHIAENPAEGEAVRAAHPWAGDYLGVYDHVGLVGDKTILAHAIHLSPSEWDRVAGAKTVIAHCPDSNFFLGSGRMRLGEAFDRGIGVALGSDVAAGRSFQIRRAMAAAHDNALCVGRRVAPEDLFAMATLGGARALGLGAVAGSLEAGKEADFAVLRLPDHVEGEAAILGALAFADAGRVEQLFVRGRPVHAA